MTPKQARQELAQMRNRAEQSESRACTVQTKVAIFQRLYGPESDHMYL